jgi:transcription elongation factor SPT6
MWLLTRIKGFGIQSHEIVLNFLASQHVHFVEDQELNPIAYAEQFVDPDPMKAVAPEELLSRARMLLSHELGKDPLLREQMRQRFKEDAYISVRPTQRGLVKIDEYTPAFVSPFVSPTLHSLKGHLFAELQISAQ